MSLLSSNNPHLPAAHYVIPRPHLVKQLEQTLIYKAILVVAPPGYGKTTAIAQFAHQTSLPVVWQTVEEYDRDLPELFRNAITALSVLFPDIQNLTFSPHISPMELANQITTYLRENVRGDFVYVLDDVHHLIAANASEAWLHTFITHLPKQCHIIMGTRLLPNLPIQEMVARNEIDVLRIDQLQFNANDITSLGSLYEVTLSPSDMQQMLDQYDGWAAGISLALQTVSAAPFNRGFRDYSEPEALFRDLAEAMLETQPPHLQNFMLKTSVLPTLTPELCSRVLEIPDSYAYLNQLFQHGLFLTKTSGKLRYHALFREFLQNELQKRSLTQFEQLHKQVAVWAEAQDKLDDAFEHYIAADEIEQARNIADRMAQPYISAGKVETLLLWLQQLQGRSVCSPRLWHACATIFINRYQYEQAEALIDEAAEFVQLEEDREGFNVLRLQKAAIFIHQGKYQKAVDLIQDLSDYADFRLAHQARALHILGLASLYLGNVQKAGSYLEQALEEARRWDDPYFVSRLLQDLDVVYMRLGQLDSAAACLQEAVALKREIGDSGSLAMALNNLGYHHHQRGGYQRAAEIFEEGFQIATRLRDNRVESYLLWSLGDLQRDRGAFADAERLYTKALQLSKRYEPPLRCAILLSLSTLHRWKGERYEAGILAKEAVALAQQFHLEVEVHKAEAFYITAQHRQTDDLNSLGTLQEKITQLRSLQAEGDLVILYALAAYIALKCSNIVAAIDFLKIIEKVKYSSIQGAVAEIYHTLELKQLVTSNSHKFGRLIGELNALDQAQLTRLPVTVQSVEPSETFSLYIKSLGVEEIRRDGNPISTHSWRATRAKELFFYLLSAGAAPREQIYLTLWPDSSPEQVRNNFHSTLYRIRQVLGENVILYEDDRYQINPLLDLSWDVRTFLDLHRQVKTFSPYDARTTDALRKAFSLYNGDFLPSISIDWVLNQRESLRQVYFDLLTIAGDSAAGRYEYGDAIKAYRKALTINPYSEAVYRSIIHCHAHMGERGQIVLEFKKLKQLLKQDLGIEPSEETHNLVLTLLG